MRWFSWTPWPVRRDTKSKRALSKPSPAGSKWCCSGNTVRTSLAPTKVVDNNVAYWRVPAIGAKGHAGVWHEGPPFSKAVNSVDQPTLTMADTNGNAVPTTNTPIVKLNPVPGGVALPVQLAPYSAGGCDWSKTNQDRRQSQAETVGIAWTPLVRQPPAVAASDRLRGACPACFSVAVWRVLRAGDRPGRGRLAYIQPIRETTIRHRPALEPAWEDARSAIGATRRRRTA